MRHCRRNEETRDARTGSLITFCLHSRNSNGNLFAWRICMCSCLTQDSSTSVALQLCLEYIYGLPWAQESRAPNSAPLYSTLLFPSPAGRMGIVLHSHILDYECHAPPDVSLSYFSLVCLVSAPLPVLLCFAACPHMTEMRTQMRHDCSCPPSRRSTQNGGITHIVRTSYSQ